MTVVTDDEVERVARALRVHRWKTKAWPTSKPPEPKNFVFLPCDLSEARAALAASDRDVLVAENERLREALGKCRDKFREYERLHFAKVRSPIHGVQWSNKISDENREAVEKAKRNSEMADMIDAALLPLGGG